MKKKKVKENKLFRNIIICAVLIIPFMYSFFYLKAYWNPYGEGNIDNLPVAIINSDEGEKGESLVNSIKDSKKLKLDVVNEKEATAGLNDGKYYAVINIPSDFSKNIESAGEVEKVHPTITYSPNQKSNYLSSQIINTVVITAEKSLDNEINSGIIASLEDKLKEVPNSLNTISDGFGNLLEGTNKLKNGVTEIKTGTETLKSGIESAYNGSKTINDKLSASIESLKNDNTAAIDNATLNTIKKQVNGSVNSTFTDDYKKVIGVKAVASVKSTYQAKMKQIEQGLLNQLSAYGVTDVKAYCSSSTVNETLKNYCNSYIQLDTLVSQLNDSSSILYMSIYNTAVEASYTASVQTANTVSENVAKSVATSAKKQATEKSIESLTTLNSGISSLTDGLYKLNEGSTSLYTGITTLENGTITLNSSVSSAKKELDNKISETKEELKKVDSLSEYAKEPVNIETKTVNEISSYGTAFAPLFISIALWVGSLMMFIVLYYDKNERFGLLGIDSEKRVKRTLAYHGLATLSGVLLAFLLQILLDFSITNILLYYFVIVLVSNCFLAIIEFLIMNFGDIGKFVALIILVLQLAASGGTFPIETVTKGFRFLNPILPMTYTVKLIKETIVSIESSLLLQNLLIVGLIFVVFFIVNIVIDKIKENKSK